MKYEETINENIDKFEYQIRKRGEEYYKNGNVIKLLKNNNDFIARVSGTNIYEVNISFGDKFTYSCNCPYQFPCKHIYAVMQAIKNKEYKEVKLKPVIKKKLISLEELTEKIPEAELKKYLIKYCFNMNFDRTHFMKYFQKYAPRDTYEYYYNKLYNNIVINDYNDESIIAYICKAKELLLISEYKESFYVLMAIVEVMHDLDYISAVNDLFSFLVIYGITLRCIYNKCSIEDRKEIDKWFNYLENKNYYNSPYLEDIVKRVYIWK